MDIDNYYFGYFIHPIAKTYMYGSLDAASFNERARQVLLKLREWKKGGPVWKDRSLKPYFDKPDANVTAARRAA